jgi:hypothetical protein
VSVEEQSGSGTTEKVTLTKSASPTAPAGKGRPTPKRRDQEQRRAVPTPPPTNRREAAARAKERAKAERKAGRAPRDLPARDQGPVRALARDVVDGRRNAAVSIMPIVLAMFLSLATRDAGFRSVMTSIYLVGLVIVLIDFVALSRLVRNAAAEQFPDESTKGLRFYAFQRSTQFRRFRMPPPVVSPPPLRRTRG